MNFGNWQPSNHTSVEQLKRIVSARKISVSKIQLTGDSSAIISGSGNEPYSVTLNDCTCFDFGSRQLPCKHIYRLALELGYLSDLPKINPKMYEEFNERISDEVSRYYKEYLSGAISDEKFLKIADALQKGK